MADRVNWKDTARKAAGTIIKVFLGGFTAVLLRILLEFNDLWPEIIALILLVWGAVVIGASNIVETALGSFTKEEAEEGKKGIDEAVGAAKIGTESTAMEGYTDEIRAKKEGITVEAYRKREYGDEFYDYRIAETERKKKLAELEEKRKAMALLEAELAIEAGETPPLDQESTSPPIPTPEPKPEPETPPPEQPQI